MDGIKIGRLIAEIRNEKGLTQKDIADALGITNKTISKWECGLGCPDLSCWPELSAILGVDMAQMMEGEIIPNKPDSGNIEKVKFYVCPTCGNILIGTGSASIFCCGRKLEQAAPCKEKEDIKISVEEMDMEYYVTMQHPMEKKHYISFAAYVKYDKVILNRLYPEQSPAFRLPVCRGGKLYVYCVEHGLSVYTDLF